MSETPTSLERQRLQAADTLKTPWRRWGPYVAERAWGSVREDYSASGNAWGNLTHEDARSTAYRWNEDGMGAICDEMQRVLLGVALWNGKDPILKERMFGLANEEGNHGEDVKEHYWYEDATPTASWLKWRYHYPVERYPYEELVAESKRRGRHEPEYELADTGIFDNGYHDVSLEIAKDTPGDLRWRLTVTNRATTVQTLHVLPTMWLRNIWTYKGGSKGRIELVAGEMLSARGADLQPVDLTWDGSPEILFCENETNTQKRHGTSGTRYPKDGINDYVTTGSPTVRPEPYGTKAALYYTFTLQPGESRTINLHLSEVGERTHTADEKVFTRRKEEADAFYAEMGKTLEDDDTRRIVRQAMAGMIHTKQFYNLDMRRWLEGDPGHPVPPAHRGAIRNGEWKHMKVRDILSMPDAWEYPWFAAWDLAFHTVALAHIDPEYAKDQLLALTREWYMHPNGQMPAYEWDFSDVNPPVHAWAALEVFHITGGTDHKFLSRIFHKLLLNFTWWTNRVGNLEEGVEIYGGGFLGMDNVGAFDRSKAAPVPGVLAQSDGTAWMAMYCLDLMQIALRLARTNSVYEDMAVKFFNHFTTIAATMNKELWDETDGFYYDHLQVVGGQEIPVKIRSMAGLVALAAVRVVPAELLDSLPEFADRIRWFLTHRPDQCEDVVTIGEDGALLLSVTGPKRLERVLEAVFSEDEFLSPHGIRSLSKHHEKNPYQEYVSGVLLGPVGYEPGESQSGLFGGNSNWRGPVWFPMNHLLVTSIRRYSQFLNDKVEVPTGSGETLTLAEAGDHLAERLVKVFKPVDGKIAAAGEREWPEGLLWFHEYFHGDTGEGLGASHQTGWTALVADLILRRNVEH